MNIQPESAHSAPFVDIDRERGGTHDKDGFVLSAHRGKSQGRPRTTPSSQLISHDGLPNRVSQQSPLSPRNRSLTAGPDAVSSPDNAFAYTKNRSLRELLRARAIVHKRTRPYTPKTNGKVERYQQTMDREWGRGVTYNNSTDRRAALPHWLEHYNTRRRHSRIGDRTPISRVHNLPGQDS